MIFEGRNKAKNCSLIWHHDRNQWEVMKDIYDLRHPALHEWKCTEQENYGQIFFSSYQMYKILGGVYGFSDYDLK